MPWTMTAFALGALSMIGVPPTVGFLSKWYILQAALEQQQIAVMAVIVVSTLLNAAYFLPIVYAAFLRPADNPGHGAGGATGEGAAHGEAPLPVVFALCVSAAGTVLLFFFPDVPLNLAHQIAGLGS
jgi:multicomponent Na+:H+ antiporter subunit D